MTRAECEYKICKKLRQIREIYYKYNPAGDYLTLTIWQDRVSAGNAEEDNRIDITLFNDGEEIRL